MLLAWLIMTIIGLSVLGLFWCSWWERETFSEWFPIVSYLDGLLKKIQESFTAEWLGDTVWFLLYCFVIIIPVVLLFWGWALTSDGSDNILPTILHVLGGVLMAIGWNQEGVAEIVLYVIAGLFVLLGLSISLPSGFFSGVLGAILLHSGLILLPAALANFGILLMLAIGIGIVVVAIKLFFAFLDNCDIIFFWRW